MSLVLSIEELAEIRKGLDQVVLAGGVFDIIHAGHIEHLKEARSLGKKLIVHIASDKRVRQKKGQKRPFLSQEERSKIVASIRYVDYVFIGEMPHYKKKIIELLKPDVLFLNKEAVSEGIKEYLSGLNYPIKIVVSETPKVNHSSRIIERLN